MTSRIRALAAGNESSVGSLHLCVRPHCKMSTAEFDDSIRALAAENDLIVIDSFSAALTGVDENAASAREPLDTLHEVATETGCAFVVVHHAGKSGGRNGGTKDVREQFRGSSAIFSAVDEAIYVKRRKDNALDLVHAKCRTSSEASAIVVKLREGEKGVTFECVDAAQDGEEQKLARELELRRRIRTYVRENPGCSATMIRSALGSRQERVAAALKMLVEKRRVENRGSSARPEYHPLVPSS